MNQTALHLVESVIPRVPVRQWVLTFPPPLRYLLAYDTDLCTRALALFVKQITTHYRFKLAQEHDLDINQLHGGTVTSIQRAGSALQASLHFHTVALDGAYLVDQEGDAPPRFLAAPAVTPVEVQAVAWSTCEAVMKMLRKRGIELTGDADDVDRLAQEHPLLARSLAASMQSWVSATTRERDCCAVAVWWTPSRSAHGPSKRQAMVLICTPACASRRVIAAGWSGCAATSCRRR